MGDRKRLSTGITRIILFTLQSLSIKSDSELKKLELLFLSLLRVKNKSGQHFGYSNAGQKSIFFNFIIIKNEEIITKTNE
jgi:hypothetical protein